jgi:hypothetical protein
MKHGFTTMTRKQSNNQVNGKMSTLLGQKKQVTKSLGKNMYSPDLAPMDFGF